MTAREPFIFRGAKTRQISFPLGGIGTGSIGLSGSGRLIDWELFHRPNKRSMNGFSHFAVKAESGGELLDARVLNGDLPPPYMGEPLRGGPLHSGYGFGPHNWTMAGMPHFEELEFCGEFPFAKLTFSDRSFPGPVEWTAFNPFIPMNDADSCIPAAFFEVRFSNPTDRPIAYTLCLSVSNPTRAGDNVHSFRRCGGAEQAVHALTLQSGGEASPDPRAGGLTIATDHPEVSRQEYWYRGAWNDNLETFWRDFTRPGKLPNRCYAEPLPSRCPNDTASLAAHADVPPGGEARIRFVLSWHYPVAYNYWNPAEPNPPWTPHYATRFADSAESAVYALTEWERLYGQTLAFKEALYSSSLPREALEAVAANLSVLKSPTVHRLTDGSFYGFEGCIEDAGSCEGSCTHVWNYAYALPFLFPRLERSMRELDYKHNLRQDGKMSFRLMLPLGREASDFRACVDGQFGGIVKCYREWKLSGDDEWLRGLWPAVKSALEFAWAETNEDRWDPQKKGVLEGRQHHTLDMELFGPNAWLNGFYLAALKAGAEMAEAMGDAGAAAEYRELFRRGRQWTEENLYNGEYYAQRIDLGDKSLLAAFEGASMAGEDAVESYWHEEAGEIKYQIGEGCGIDQVVAQWHANLCGLGDIFDKDRTKSALRALFRHNFKTSMRGEANTWRLFSLNDEAGLVICTWPEGRRRPAVPLTYHSETMTGFEYQAASHMIQEGLIEEGMTVVRAIRDRYDGEKRNPWNEIECGSNYARSMASYSLLLAFSGFVFDMREGMIGFFPKRTGGGAFRTFWSAGGAWGTFTLESARVRLDVLWGSLSLRELRLPAEVVRSVSAAQAGGRTAAFAGKGERLRFAPEVVLAEGETLVLEMDPRGTVHP